MIRKEVLELSAEDFFTHIITIICDYAKINGYEITDAVKTIGENLSEITEIATFDNWEINEEALGKDINVTSKWIPCSERLPKCNGCYLVWRPHFFGGEIGMPAICYFDGQDTWHDSYGVDFTRILNKSDVVAWQPLPEPYKEE